MEFKLSEEEKERYDRQMMIPNFGEEGQLKLKKSKVTVVGAGGLGCSVTLYLAAAGVGTLTIIDPERVELSNLNRQVLHWTEDIGELKAVSVARKLEKLNPAVEVKAVPERLTMENVRGLIGGSDVVVDCLDNWHTRFLLNEACVAERIPMVHAGIRGLYGQMTTIIPYQTPCLRCILPETPPEEKRFPVLGTTPGVLGVLEAFEALKLIVGIGVSLAGKLLVFDGEAMSFQEIRVERNESCSVCGEKRF